MEKLILASALLAYGLLPLDWGCPEGRRKFEDPAAKFCRITSLAWYRPILAQLIEYPHPKCSERKTRRNLEKSSENSESRRRYSKAVKWPKIACTLCFLMISTCSLMSGHNRQYNKLSMSNLKITHSHNPSPRQQIELLLKCRSMFHLGHSSV
jgi:hypothetical protein